MSELWKWWPMVWAVLNLLGLWIMWSLSSKFVSSRDCRKCRDAIEKRIAEVESDSRHAPKHGDLSKIYERINAVAGKVDDQGGELRAIRRSLELINQHLLSQGSK